MIKLMMGVSLAALLSVAALAQSDKNIPARPDSSVNANEQSKGSKVAPIPAPDASTQAGQERGNAAIVEQSHEQSQQNAPGSGGTSKPGVAGEPGIKSGSTVTPENKNLRSSTASPNTMQQDQSKVPGMKGNKSGTAPKE